MPRKKRLWEPNMCHHVMLRGIDGRSIFKDNQDRARFLLLLQEASELCCFHVHAFCLMDNHIHLMLEPKTMPLAVGVHRFAGRYAQYFNGRHKKRGYVFQGRFRSIIVQDGLYIRRLVRYIHLNPVEAKIVTHPGYYQWSSYNGYLGHAEYAWLHKDRVLSYFATTRMEAIVEMAIHIELKVDASVDADEIRKSFRKGAFGNEAFIETYALTQEFALDEPFQKDAPCRIDSLVNVICKHFAVTVDELCSSEKRRELVQARGVLARAAQIKKDLGLRMVCETLQKRHGTVSRLAAAVRKNEELERLATHLINNSVI